MAQDQPDLSASQTEQLLQFQDLTGIEDMDKCRLILENHNWDIEIAVQDTLNEAEGLPPAYTPSPPPPAPRTHPLPIVNHNPFDQRVFSVVRRPQGFIGWTCYIVMFPFRFVYTTVFDILRFLWHLFRPVPRITVTDPLGDVMSFIEEFRRKYGDLHPTFYQGTYSQALTDAKSELKFLLVYMHDDESQDTAEFCRETLCNSEVVEFVNTKMLCWACSINSPEGNRVSRTLHIFRCPFLALIVLRESRMTVIARMDGPIMPTFLIDKLSRVVADNEPSLIAARADREQWNLNQSIRQEQDLAYMQSLKADQEKTRRRQEEIERKEQEEREAKEQQMREQKRKEEIENHKLMLVDEIPSEPASDDPNSLRIVLKLPHGVRLERRFLRTHSLKYLYYYVFCHSETPDDFQIVTNFPRRVLPCKPENDTEPPTFEEVGLGKSEMLFVQDNMA